MMSSITGLASDHLLADRAAEIVTTLANSLNTPYHGSSSMTDSIYDTVWVAMVSKTTSIDQGGSKRRWLFPQCFRYILDNQQQDGSFGAESSEVDSILNTLAATLAFCKYQDPSCSTYSIPTIPEDEVRRAIARGEAYLNRALKCWDVLSTVHIGFEILVPKMLDLLRREGLDFQFPGLRDLMILNSRKLGGIKPSVLYTSHTTSLLHSLEAFVGVLDMDKVSHHLINGSMMNSPSSTAAYLANLSEWDDEAETYLRFVVDNGNGGVPSAFPISIFETGWVLTAFFDAGLGPDELGKQNLSKLGDFLESELGKNDGLVGFGPGILPDGDDTAKAIQCMHHLGRSVDCQKMIESFETNDRFKTYEHESTESFSVNCNVLVALMSSRTPAVHLPEIKKVLGFLCQRWYEGNWNDKWNLEPQYCMMLFAQSLVRALRLWDSSADDPIISTLEEYVGEHIPLVTVQILVRTLSAQHDDGSWNGCAETTAYGLLTLKGVAHLPWFAPHAIEETVIGSIARGEKFLLRGDAEPAKIWVEKVTYGSSMLSQTYCLASLVTKYETPSTGSSTLTRKVPGLSSSSLFGSKKLSSFTAFLSKLPILSTEPLWRLYASVVEGYLLAPRLQRCLLGLKIFQDKLPAVIGEETTGYLEYIPVTWTSCNNAASFGTTTQTLLDMMCISALNFQIDKYLEDITEEQLVLSNGSLGFEAIRWVIESLCQDGQHESRSHHVEMLSPKFQSLLHEVRQTLVRFKDFIVDHPRVSQATPVARRRLLRQLSAFLQAHISQGEDNAQRRTRIARDTLNGRVFQGARDKGHTYYEWVHTTSADHTSCPYSFEFFTCLISAPPRHERGVQGHNQVEDCFSVTSLARYLASDVCRHLATLCRQYNDYGSVRRDHAEKNLNSIDFPEFHRGLSQPNEVETVAVSGDVLDAGSAPESQLREEIATKDRRAQLMDVASYERECLELALGRLRGLIDTRTAHSLQVFIHVTDLYGQIYAIRDINSSN